MRQQEYRLGYRADLEGLRGIAILLVVAVHTGVPWLGGGYVGVDVFFVLSGFLITGLIVREKRTTGTLRFADFYVRRLRRLLPALFLMLVVVCACAMLILVPEGQRQQFTLATAASVWSSNIYLGVKQFDYFVQGTGANWFLHTWSLGVEEQFYLVWPALLVWLLGRGSTGRLKRLKAGMWLVVAASLVACVTLTYVLPQPAFYMMPTRAWQFAAGALAWIYFIVPGTDPAARTFTRP
ncbi:MAG TPA: acyltransferase, partial [Rhodanobacteraceae bacterium]|nr:acyltransferase [Rhodanobacteraceae bacterium]